MTFPTLALVNQLTFESEIETKAKVSVLMCKCKRSDF